VVLTVKVPLVCPLAIVMPVVLGVAAALSLASVTGNPALGAGPVRVTVPADEVPPVTEVGLTATEDSAAMVDEGVNTTSA